jgi:hypothetical protein
MIFIRFDELGRQIETVTIGTAPGPEWIQAPDDFSWDKQYKLVAGEIQALTQADIEAKQLENDREHVFQMLYNEIENAYSPYNGATVQDFAKFLALLNAAKGVIANEPGAKELLTPYAAFREKTVQELAEEILEEQKIRQKSLVFLLIWQEILAKETQQILTLEELQDYPADFRTRVDAAFRGENAN